MMKEFKELLTKAGMTIVSARQQGKAASIKVAYRSGTTIEMHGHPGKSIVDVLIALEDAAKHEAASVPT